eukprot:10251898-Lingulodinium_polyedra.AAC.1
MQEAKAAAGGAKLSPGQRQSIVRQHGAAYKALSLEGRMQFDEEARTTSTRKATELTEEASHIQD